jgi:hypothetical protein
MLNLSCIEVPLRPVIKITLTPTFFAWNFFYDLGFRGSQYTEQNVHQRTLLIPQIYHFIL